jgi:hypothetical protein
MTPDNDVVHFAKKALDDPELSESILIAVSLAVSWIIQDTVMMMGE